MKYILKKDLPFAKVGEGVDYEDLFNRGRIITNSGYFVGYDFQTLISEGWIEEIKPREWYISKYAINDYARENIESFTFADDRKDLIKIKEVIEWRK